MPITLEAWTLNYLKIVLIWSLATFLWGLIGVSIGPGIMMLIIGAIIGFSGVLFSITCEVFSYNIGILWSGFIVSTTSIVLMLSIFQNNPLTITGNVFLVLFIVIPSYLVIFFLNKTHHQPPHL